MILGVRDLDEATQRLRDEHGLGAVEGGRNPGERATRPFRSNRRSMSSSSRWTIPPASRPPRSLRGSPAATGPARLARHGVILERAAHDRKPSSFQWIEVGGDHEDLYKWLGPNDLPIRFAGGEPGIRAAAIAAEGGKIVLR